MRFSLVHKACSYLVIVTSTIALFASGELHPIMLLITAIGFISSWLWEQPRVEIARYVNVWNTLTVLALGKTVFDVFTGASVLVSAIYFIVFLSLNKLFNRQTSADYLQLYVVSLLQMIAATALSSDMTYGVLFLFYIVFSTWTLILFHLKREMEDNFLLKYGESLEGKPVQVQRVLDSRRLVGWRFLGVTSLVSIVVFISAASFFFLFPRVGFRLFSQSRPGLAMAGFSTEVELGHFGLIKDNPTVVMRVEFDTDSARHQLPKYWRGVSFDKYDGRRWTKSYSRTKRTLARRGNRVRVAAALQESTPVRQKIYLEPMESRVLFALHKVNHLDFPKMGDLDIPGRYRAIQRDLDGDLYYEQLDEIAFRYTAESTRTATETLPPTLSAAAYSRLMETFEKRAGDRFRQMPAELDDRVLRLAQSIAGQASTVSEAVSQVETYLKSNYSYTLNLGRDERMAPLEDFLFNQKRGHCEYFASSMVILLRSLGIGARLVNGFHGGRWNSFGNYLAVTQGEAHSWVEVLVPERLCADGVCEWRQHWTMHDPTPSGRGGVASAGLWLQVQQYTDAFRMRWYKYVIEYDLERQVGFIVAVRDGWRRLSGDSKSKSTSETATSDNPKLAYWVGAALAFVVAVGFIIAFWRRRTDTLRDSQRDRQVEKLVSLLDALFERYARFGWTRSPAETTQEFLERLRQDDAPGLHTASRVVKLYESVRFAGLTVGDETISTLAIEVRALKGATSP
jgi:protein-glutamine gamma-glutamyltransferase